jgi:uncharacterized membrane protein
MHFGLPFLVALGTFLVLDLAWLVLAGAAFFKGQLGSVLRDQPNFAPAALFYIVYALGMMELVVRPALQAGLARLALRRGAVLGLVAYATFDLTNLAIVRGWTIPVALVDIAWGTIASAIACWCAYRMSARQASGVQ